MRSIRGCGRLFYKIFVGLFLKLHGDVFIVPRILVGIAGLALLLILLQLADTLFSDRKVSLIATLLAIPIPDRLIFSIMPMSDIFFYLLLVGASIFSCAGFKRVGGGI
jgi:hypothetical protein